MTTPLAQLEATQATVMMVEDNRRLREANLRILRNAGYQVRSVANLSQAREALHEGFRPDVLLLDIMLPDGDGRQLLQDLPIGVDPHVIFLTALNDSKILVSALEQGGDDYMTKPYRVSELLARVGSAVRRRQRSAPDHRLRLGRVSLDLPTATGYVGDQSLKLTSREFAVLYQLGSHFGQPVSAADLLANAWDELPAEPASALKTTVWRLRQKLDDQQAGLVIQTVRGTGYRLESAG
jgi:DNA-binding response OmpR family regulator